MRSSRYITTIDFNQEQDPLYILECRDQQNVVTNNKMNINITITITTTTTMKDG